MIVCLFPWREGVGGVFVCCDRERLSRPAGRPAGEDVGGRAFQDTVGAPKLHGGLFAIKDGNIFALWRRMQVH